LGQNKANCIADVAVSISKFLISSYFRLGLVYQLFVYISVVDLLLISSVGLSMRMRFKNIKRDGQGEHDIV